MDNSTLTNNGECLWYLIYFGQDFYPSDENIDACEHWYFYIYRETNFFTNDAPMGFLGISYKKRHGYQYTK